MKHFLLLPLFIFIFQSTFSQYQIGIIPRKSPDKRVYQKVGYTEIEIQYGGPSVKDREIWGELVPYDKIWRTGANSATTVEINSPITIGDSELPAGKYSFFTIPKENAPWVVIFNKESQMWGTFNYTESEDALRFEVTPSKTDQKVESLIFRIDQQGFQKGSITLLWESLELKIPFTTDYLEAFEREIESRADKQPKHIQWIPYLQGAEHLEVIRSNKPLAEKWIAQAEDMMNETTKWDKEFYPRAFVEANVYWVKAKVLAWSNDFTGAIMQADKIKELQTGQFYEKQNEREGIDELYESWKE